MLLTMRGITDWTRGTSAVLSSSKLTVILRKLIRFAFEPFRFTRISGRL